MRDRILAGNYDLLGYRGLNFCSSSSRGPSRRAPDVDWHSIPCTTDTRRASAGRTFPYLDPAIGDHKIIWELNRHQHWLQLGRACVAHRSKPNTHMRSSIRWRAG